MSVVSIKHDVKLRVMDCGTCGTPFAMPETLYDTCYREGGFWSCPMGHRRGWTEGQEARDKASLKNRLAKAEQERDSAVKRKEWAEMDAANKAKELSRLKKRTAAGVCPCCNRTFKQLAAHMKRKHPDAAK